MKLVIYHDNCADGFCCAWLMKHAFPNAEFFAANYGMPPPDVKDKEVYIVDFSYKKPIMEKLIEEAKSVVVLDHHETAEEELSQLSKSDKLYIKFDMKKSGGRLTFEYLQRTTDLFTNPVTPWLVEYTEDRDLWKWKLPYSREISVFISSYPFDFDIWNWIYKLGSTEIGIKDIRLQGEAIIRNNNQIIEKHCKNAYEIVMDGHKVLCVNATTLISEIAGKLAKGRPFGCSYFVRSDGKQIWSLRSDENGLNVSKIAKIFGGGGHEHAAGFERPGVV